MPGGTGGPSPSRSAHGLYSKFTSNLGFLKSLKLCAKNRYFHFKLKIQEIHNGQKIYPKTNGFVNEDPKKKLAITAKMVNKGFIIAFPIIFVVFISFMVLKVVLAPKGLQVV